MKLIKLQPDHYIMVNDSEIKEGDFSFYPPFGIGKNIVIDGELCFYIESKNGKGSLTQRTYQTLDKNKKITHSTKPLSEECKTCTGYCEQCVDRTKSLSLQEVKELIGEVDVVKKAKKYTEERNYLLEEEQGYIAGYNQALEDNKEKKYTKEDLKKVIDMARDVHDYGDNLHGFYWTEEDIIQSLQPQTEWEVEFDEHGKLKLI